MNVAIIDYGLCNLDSVARALEECGGRGAVSNDPEAVLAADAVILPGVGTFRDAMAGLRAKGLDEALTQRVVREGAPFLGICLGMQLLASLGHEVERTAGLDWIPGEVARLESCSPTERVPHIGWNELHFETPAPLFRGIEPGTDFYFVHSFHFRASHAGHVLGTTPYCGGFVSAVGRDNIFGVQFHPEKSQKAGFTVLRNFLAL